MPESEVQILRNGEVLGSLPRADAVELLRLGFFRADDHYSTPDMVASRPLSELAAESIGPQPGRGQGSWLERARQTVTDTTSTLAHSAWETAEKLRSMASRTPAGVTKATNQLLEGYLPQIRVALARVTGSGPFQAVRASVHDDELMRKTFGAVYDLLPRPVCRFVSEERFISFCLERRNGLLGTNVPGENDRHDSPATPDDVPPQGGS